MFGWPKRKAKRAEPQDASRPDRRLRVYRLLVKVAWLSVAVALFAVGVQVRRYLLNTPRLALKTVDVRGVIQSSAWEVRVLGGLENGTNLLSIDLDAAVKGIKRHPWIGQVSIRRVLPDRLEIMVEEREPVALLALQQLYYVDKEGVIFKRVRPGERLEFPVLTGFDHSPRLQRGDIGRQAIKEMLALLNRVKATTPFGAEQIAEVHLDPDQGYSLYLSGGVARVHLGWEPFDRKLERLTRLVKQEQLDLGRIRQLELDLKKSAVVTPL